MFELLRHEGCVILPKDFLLPLDMRLRVVCGFFQVGLLQLCDRQGSKGVDSDQQWNRLIHTTQSILAFLIFKKKQSFRFNETRDADPAAACTTPPRLGPGLFHLS